MTLLLPYGQAPDGRLISVAEAARGAACECICPKCSRPLIARKGFVLRHHFAHASDADCAGALETVLHKFGKQTLAEARDLLLPALSIRVQHLFAEPVVSRVVPIQGVQIEKQIGSIRPDAILTVDDRPLGVEIFVTHTPDPDKIAALKSIPLDTIEIDLHGYSFDSMTDEEARHTVTHVAFRKWLWCAAGDEARARLTEQIAEERRQAEIRRFEFERRAENARKAREFEAHIREMRDAEHLKREAMKYSLKGRLPPTAPPKPPPERVTGQLAPENWKMTLLDKAIDMLGRDAAFRWFARPTITSDLSAEKYPVDVPVTEVAGFHYELEFAARMSLKGRPIV